MNRLFFSAFLLLLCSIPNSRTIAAQSKTSSDRSQIAWVLRFNGIGPVKIGMSLSELKKALHNDAKEEASGNESCFYVSTSKHPQVVFMIIDDHVVRIDVTQRGVPTTKGIRVGDSESKVKRSYPQLSIEPHAYTPDGKYLTVHSDDGHLGLRFETEKRRITGFYAGRSDAIQYIEGCD